MTDHCMMGTAFPVISTQEVLPLCNFLRYLYTNSTPGLK